MIAHRDRLSIPLTRTLSPVQLSRPARAVKVRHALVALAVACLTLGIVLQPNGSGAGRAVTAGALARSYQQEGLLSLPAAAQGPVSAALGKDSLPYRVTAAADGYRAASPGQRLTLRFTRSGVSVRSGRGQMGLALREIGYGTRLHSVGGSSPRAAANRVSYALGAGVREWYANGPLGLEQGFDLERSPGVGNGPLTLSLALSGNLRARLTGGGVSLTGRGAALRYAGLVVRDARGRKLRAWVELRHERVLIRIADRGARYPLRIDPWVQNGELTASDGADIGKSVAISGNTIVVGAPSANGGAGAVYVFTAPATGWANATQTAVLTPSNPETGEAFGGQQLGYSVAISGSTIVAGAPYWTRYNIPGGGNIEYAGAVYEWTLPKSGVWTSDTQTAYLTATNLTQVDYLGTSVAVQGSTIVAGAPNHLGETPQGGPGSVYVYTMPAGGWVNANQTAQLSGYDPDAGDGVGYSVAISGSTIVAGAPEEEWDGVGNYESRGGVYVWTEPVAGGWVSAFATAELIPSDLNAFDELGISVAVSGSTIVGGALGHSSANRAPGTVYVWTLPPVGGWNNATQPAELTSTDVGGPGIGFSVAVSGSTIFSGAVSSTTNVQGAVDKWTLPASGFWAAETQADELTASDGTGGARFGNSVATSGSTIVVGAPSEDASTGAAYVFSTGNPGSIDWEMPARVALGKDNLNAEGLPPASYVYPGSWSSSLFLDDNGVRVTSCPTGYTWKWTVVAVTIPSGVTPTITQPADGCTSSFTTTALGTYKVTAEQYQATTSTGVVVTNSDVVLNDVLIVGLGDSNGSGEGDLPFYNTQCDRGVASEQYQAADDLERQFKGHTSVTFVADACSGARTQDLYPDSYAGVNKGTPLPPQITALSQLIADHGNQPARKVDAAFVSAGINNLAFGPLLEVCAQLHHACENIPMEPDYANGVVTGFTTYPDTKDPTLKQWIARFTDLLPSRFDAIAPMLKELVAPDRTFISDYPTFVYPTANKDEVCDDSVFPYFKTSVWQWLLEAGSALNAEVNKTTKLGWRPVVVNPYLFLGHGYCAGSQSWFVTLGRAIVHNINGAFHATSRGALVTAELNVAAVCPVVAKASECKGIKTPASTANPFHNYPTNIVTGPYSNIRYGESGHTNLINGAKQLPEVNQAINYGGLYTLFPGEQSSAHTPSCPTIVNNGAIVLDGPDYFLSADTMCWLFTDGEASIRQ